MNQYFMCTFEGHENEQIIGFCVNEICSQIPQFCLQCIKERHKNHVDDCKNFQQFQEIVIKSLKQQQKELDELEKVHNTIKKAYKQYSQILVSEISKIQQLIEMFAQRQYYDIKSMICTLNLSQKSFIPKTQWLTKPNLIQEFVQKPKYFEGDKVKAQELLKQGMKLVSKLQEILILDQQNLSEALHFFNESIKNDPSIDDVYRWKGRTLQQMRVSQKARQSNQENQKKHQMHVKWQFRSTLQMILLILQRLPRQQNFLQDYKIFDLGQYNEVIIFCDKAIKINPQNDAAFVNKGRLNRYQEELMCYEKSIEINRKNETAYINKGCALKEDESLFLNQIARSNIKKQSNVVMNFFRQTHNFIKLIRQKVYLYFIRDRANLKEKPQIIHEIKQYKEAIKQFDKAYQISKNVEYLVAKADTLLSQNLTQIVFDSGQKNKSKQFYVEAQKKGYQDIQYLEEKISQI